MWKTVLTILTIMVLVSACATPRFTHQEYMDKAPFKYGTPTNEQLIGMPGIDGPILTVAVYNFIDKPIQIAVVLIFITGLYDDIKGLMPHTKLLFQIVSSVMVISTGIIVGKGVLLPDIIAIPLTILWIIGITKKNN